MRRRLVYFARRAQQLLREEGLGSVLSKGIRRLWTLRPRRRSSLVAEARTVCIVLPGLALSGGVLVALRHARMLQDAGWRVTIATPDGGHVDGLNVVSVDTLAGAFELLVATMWSTVEVVLHYPHAHRRAYLVQGLETGFYAVDDPRRELVLATYERHDLRYLTISRWCEHWLTADFGQRPRYAPNGIDVAAFAERQRDFSGKLVILIEGVLGDRVKNVEESYRIVEGLDRSMFDVWHVAYDGNGAAGVRVIGRQAHENMPELYAACHILLKTSVQESFSYPPLEMMATGGLVVVAGNDGNAEFVQHEHNALVYSSGDVATARAHIRRLRDDAALRERLIRHGRATAEARAWERVRPQVLALYEEA